MKKVLLGALAIALLSTGAYALEETVANFDSGVDPVNMGGAKTSSNGSAGEWAYSGYDATTCLGPTGQSLHIAWSGVNALNRWACGGLTFCGGTDGTVNVSTYNCVSFWIYTPNANTKVEVQFKDDVATVQSAAKVKLSDYLTTGTSSWQEVSIPLAAFQRNLSTIDLTKAYALIFSADYTNGLECDAAGDIHIDDVKFSSQHHAPARSLVYSGSDKGTANAADMPGDTLLWWDQAASTVAANEVKVTVSTGCAIVWISSPSVTNTVAAGTTYYYAFSIRNDGNVGDRIFFSTQTLNGTNPWQTRIYWDKDKSGAYSAGDVECWNSIGLLPDSTHYFLAGIFIPAAALNTSSTTIRMTARDNYGSGANDSWPTVSNDDTLTADFSAICMTPALVVVKSTDVAVAKPGATVTYTISVTNNGGANATNVQVTDVVPANMQLSGAASGAGATIQYYAGSSWTGSWSQSATKVRWTWGSIASGGGSASASFPVTVK